uniref:CCDC92 domain-containing protein n=1 Tax=Thelazia callipaeda TaxID=103827 RepID=A0A0N5CPB7_THECL
LAYSDVEVQNRRLQRELRQKDTIIQELKQKVTFLERRVVELTGEELPVKYDMLVENDSLALPGESIMQTLPQLHSQTLQQPITHNLPALNNNNTTTVAQSAPALPSTFRLSNGQGIKFRRNRQITPKIISRRNDVRFHSNPAIPVTELTVDYPSNELRRSMIIPVSERRKFFETIAEYSSPF